MKRYFIVILMLFFVFPVHAISSYKASYDLYAETDLGYFKYGGAEYELVVAHNAYVFTSNAHTDILWRAIYDYSSSETSIGLIEDNKLIVSYYKINEVQGNLINDNYEINIYPNEHYASLNNDIEWKINSGDIADALSIYLFISEDIQKYPNKKVFIYQVVDKKGVRQKEFTIDGIETVNIGNNEVETIRIICPEFRLIINVSKDHNFMPVLIKKTNGQTKYQLTLKDYKG